MMTGIISSRYPCARPSTSAERKMLDLRSVESTLSDNDNDRPASVIFHRQSMTRSKRRPAGPPKTSPIAKRMSKSHASNSGTSTTDNKGTEAEEEQLVSLLQDHPTTTPRLPGRTIGGCAKSRHSNLDTISPGVIDPTPLASNPKQSCKIRVPYDTNEWSPEEDKRLVDMLRTGKSWHPIAISLGRGHDQCRMRWRDHLQQQNSDLEVSFTRPRVIGTERWTEKENKLLLAMHAEGKSWEFVSKALPGRTVSMCRAHWRETLSMKHSDTPKMRYRESKKWSAEDDRWLIAMYREGRTWKSMSDTIPGYTNALCKARWHRKHRYPEVPKSKNVDPSASWTAEGNDHLAAIYSQGQSWKAISGTLPKSTPRMCRWCSQILRKKKKHPEITPYSRCERIHALTGPRASENRMKKIEVPNDDGVPAVELVVTKKRQIADAAPTRFRKRIKLSISPQTNPRHPEQGLESDSETTSEAYNVAAGKAWWMAFASEILKEAQNMDRSRSEDDASSVGDEEGKRWGEYGSSAQMAPHESDHWTAEGDDDNDETDDREGSLIDDLPVNGQSQKSSSLSDAVTVGTPYDMTDLQIPSNWESEDDEPVESESYGKGRQRYAILSRQAQSSSQQPDSHAKALPHAGIVPDCAKPLAENGSVSIQNTKSEPTDENGRHFPMLKAEAARRRGLEALLRCAAQDDEW